VSAGGGGGNRNRRHEMRPAPCELKITALTQRWPHLAW